MEFTFTSSLWQWQGQGAWFFVSVPKEYYEQIHQIGFSQKRGFGSVKAEATIGKTIWKTSIFPDSKSGMYLLPVKKDVRKSENLGLNNLVVVKLRLYEV